MTLALILLACLLAVAATLETGAPLCANPPRDHGVQTINPAGAVFVLLDSDGAAATSYVPEKTYTINLQIASWQGITSSVYKGGSKPLSLSATKAGAVRPVSATLQQNECDGITHREPSTKASTPQMKWFSPPAGTGPVTIFAFVVVDKGKTVYSLYRTIAEAGAAVSPSTSPAALPSAGASLAATSSSTEVIGDVSGEDESDEDDGGTGTSSNTGAAPTNTASTAITSPFDLHPYAASAQLHAALSLSWIALPSTTPPSIAMKMVFTPESPVARSAIPWVAIGVNNRRAMVGSDAIVFQPGIMSTSSDALLAVNQHVLSGETPSGTVKVNPSQQTMNRTSAAVQVVWTLNDGSTVSSLKGAIPSASALIKSISVEFQRPAGTSSPYSSSARRSRRLQTTTYTGARPIAIDGSGPSTVVYGIGDPTRGILSMHSSLNVGTASIDFSPGSNATVTVDSQEAGIFTTADSLWTAQVVHGAIMFVAFGLCMPIGILVARFTKGYPTPSSTCWFLTHKTFQILAVVLSLLGFLLGILIVSPGPHFDCSHSIVGLAVVLAGVIQLIVGACCRPPKMVVVQQPASPDGVTKEVKERPRKRLVWEIFHKSVGYGTALVAVVAIFLGIEEINGDFLDPNVADPYAVLVALLAFAWIACECYQRWNARNKQQKADGSGKEKPAPTPVAHPNPVPPQQQPVVREQELSAAVVRRRGQPAAEEQEEERKQAEEEEEEEEEEGEGDDDGEYDDGRSDGDGEADDPTPHFDFKGKGNGSGAAKSLAGPAGTRAAATAPMRSP
jgi:Eukaryotic cytochrome b561/Reeler domain